MFNCNTISLKRGSTGQNVKTLQTNLKKLGYYTTYNKHYLKIDGVYGVYTELAVKNFQRKYGLNVDGWFAANTCKKLTALIEGTAAANNTNTSTSNNNNSNVSVTSNTPDYLKQFSYELKVFNDVVLVPSLETDNNNNQTVGAGATSTETNFNCSTINLKRGSKGDDVTKLQTLLKARGYYTRQIDGSYGKYTEAGVKKLQKAQGNTADGVFGPKTCNKLQNNNSTNNTSTSNKNKNTATSLIITEFKNNPSMTRDIESLSEEITLQTIYTKEKLLKLKQYQKTEFNIILDGEIQYTHPGYINSLKISNEDDLILIELNLVGYTAFLETTVEVDKTAKISELLKYLAELVGLQSNINMDGFTDSTVTLKTDKATSTGGTGSKTLQECFDMGKSFTHPYKSGYQKDSSTKDPETAWNAYNNGTRHFDCFGCTAFLYYVVSNFAKKPVRGIRRRSAYSKSGYHHMIQLKNSSGEWYNPDEYYKGFDSYLTPNTGRLVQVLYTYEG